MRNYISVDMVKATPAVAIDGRLYVMGNQLPAGKEIEHGYKLLFDNGAESFCSDADFETFFLPLDVNENLKTDKPSISEKMVDNFIARFYATTVGDKTTVVRAVLVNGFEIVESSSCVSPENYDEEIGKEICIGKIKDKVWELLGFLLATAVNGFNYESRYPSILHEEMRGSLEDEEEALPYPDLPEGEDCEEGCGNPEPCEEDCGGDDCGCPPLSIVPCPPEQGCCDDPAEDCEKTEGDYYEVHSKVKKSKEPVSIIIAEEEGNRLKIEMNGESEFVFAALESAVVAAFCAEFHEANIEMQKLVADSWAADIGRRIRDTILGTVTTEKR